MGDQLQLQVKNKIEFIMKFSFSVNCTLILIVIFFSCCISCTNGNQKEKNSVNCFGDGISGKELNRIFKDFEMFKFKPIPFSEEEEICYPYVMIEQTSDNKMEFDIFYTKNLTKQVVFEKKGKYWEAEKQTINQAFQGIPKANNKVILLNDSTVLSIGKLFKLKEGYYQASWYVKYEKSRNHIYKSRFNGTGLTQYNIDNLEIWDSVTYRKNSVLPYIQSELRLFKNVFIDSGLEYPSKESGKKNNEDYMNEVEHDINSASFFYYLFRWW